MTLVLIYQSKYLIINNLETFIAAYILNDISVFEYG